MPAAASDTHIKARWIAPMTGDRELLEHHTLVIRDGRIAAILPDPEASTYEPRVILDRPTHLLMPGLVDAYTRIGSPARSGSGMQYLPDTGLSCIANMLKSGITCFCEIGHFPSDAARAAVSQGMRAVVGLPVAETPGPWAQNAGEYLTKALRLRDDYKGHPSISTRFAPLGPASLSDEVLARMGTLAAELDAGITVSLQGFQQQIDESITRFGVRPLARLESLGLLTPALTAAHMALIEADEVDIAQRSGIAVTLCLASSLLRANRVPPLADLTAANTRLSLGDDGGDSGVRDIWTEIKLLALHSPQLRPWEMLAAAGRGGAAALGLDSEIGTLETGKWADLCCLDLAGPATQPVYDPLRQVVLSGGRDLVTDVWVAGRQLLSDGQFTRLDWPSLAARLSET